jgi:UDP-N-acetylmuramoylalanine--D-glutamate ligase
LNFDDQQIAVLGAGTSGIAAARLSASRGAKVTVFDSGRPEKLAAAAERLDSEGLPYVFGENALTPRGGETDLVVVSPGIDLASEIAQAFARTGAPIIGEIELAWRCAPDIPVAGITGTNGKTTTTEILATLLHGAGIASVAAGNYGRAYTDVVLSGERLDAIALELSSFQLETVDRFHPRVAVWMNFAADHMDRYTSLDDYRAAKLRIFENQTADDLAVVNGLEIPACDFRARCVTFSGFAEGSAEVNWTLADGNILRDGEVVLDYASTRLNGRHNAENLMAAMAAAAELGAPIEGMAASIAEYTAPPHRSEWIADVNGVSFVNDSKATNLHALESSLRGQEKPVVLIAGGKNKGLDYSELIGEVARTTTKVIAIGEMAESILAAWAPHLDCESAGSLDEAVRRAAAAAAPGQTVLFSPGTSSFDMFASYQARGDAFRESVQQLTTTQPQP